MTAESVQGRRRPVTRGYLRSRGVYCVCGEAQCHLQTASLGRGIVVEGQRSEEHTSELQSLMRISYAVFCLKKKTNSTTGPDASLISHLLPVTRTLPDHRTI